MIRRTITLPEGLATEIDSAVAGGAAANVSQFLQAAARHHVDRWRNERLAKEAAKLDPDEEIRLVRDPGDQQPPWGRLA